MDKKLYIATDLEGGDLLGAVWATSKSVAYDYFNNKEPMIPEQNDRLYVELAEKSDYSMDDIKDEFPEVFEENLTDNAAEDSEQLSESVEPSIYEMAAARAMHFMFTNYNMDYQEIADELGIDVQVVLDLIGPDSYDDKDIMLEATRKSDKLDEATNKSEDDEEFYEDVVELFDSSGIGFTKVLVDTYIKDILEDASVEEPNKEKLRKIVASEELLDELIEVIKTALDESATLQNYISDYSVAELGDMDSPWNTVMDITNDSIFAFIDKVPTEVKKLKESYRRTVSRGNTLVDNELFVDFD
jgi:hypothetical protein